MSGTPVAWGPRLQHRQYGTRDTYDLAAAWLKDCPTVADWGGGAGYFEECLPPSVTYTLVEGTAQGSRPMFVADLERYVEPSDGILLRHVLDCAENWQRILRNALAAARQRIVVVTFLPDAGWTHITKYKSGWPIWRFDPADLRLIMGTWIVREDNIRTTHTERVYYLQRPR